MNIMRLPHLPFEFEPEQVHQHNLQVISIRNESMLKIVMSTAPATPLELAPLPGEAKIGSTFLAPVKQRNPLRRGGGRDWLPCWFGGLDQAAKDEA